MRSSHWRCETTASSVWIGFVMIHSLCRRMIDWLSCRLADSIHIARHKETEQFWHIGIGGVNWTLGIYWLLCLFYIEFIMYQYMNGMIVTWFVQNSDMNSLWAIVYGILSLVFSANMCNIIIGCRRWLLSKLFEEICLEDSSSDSSDAAHHCNKTKSGSVTRLVLDVDIASHSDLRHHIVLRELSVCHSAADCYHSNYNAWNHRIWVMNNFTCCRMQVCNIPSTRHALWLLLLHGKMHASVASE